MAGQASSQFAAVGRVGVEVQPHLKQNQVSGDGHGVPRAGDVARTVEDERPHAVADALQFVHEESALLLESWFHLLQLRLYSFSHLS